MNNRKKIPYRSPHFVFGSTDRKLHFHIDVPEEETENLIEVISVIEELGFDCAVDRVRISIGGPQRMQIPWMYDLHNVPGDQEGVETFGAFSSTVIQNSSELVSVIKATASQLSKIKGGIIEAELPVGLFNQNGWQLLLRQSEYIDAIESSEIGFKVGPSMRFETHHWFSVPKNGNPPIDLKILGTFLRDAGVTNTGGLFILDAETNWGYASNSFSNDGDFQERIEKEQSVYRKFLEQERLPADTLESLVELIVLIVKTEDVQ